MIPTQSEWQLIADRLRDRLGEDVYASWFAQARPLESEKEGVVCVALPTRFIADYVKDKWSADILRECQQALATHVTEIAYVARPQAEKTTESATLRSVPNADLQPDMFIPDITEIAIKDDVHLMEIAPFTLQPRGEGRKELYYEDINGTNIRIKANPDYGLVTALDYDIVLMMQSWLADLANAYRDQMKRYAIDKAAKRNPEKPAEPPRYFEPHIKEMLLFSRDYQNAGDNQRVRIEGALNRLKNTSVMISKASGRKHRRYGTFSFIHDWEIIAETESGKVSQVKIEIPGWIYDGIVKAKNPTILTYHRDYLLIKKPLLRFLYRLCRLYNGRISGLARSHVFTVADLRERSGSRLSQKEFNRKLKACVEETQKGGFFDWELRLQGQREQQELVVTRKQQLVA